MRLLKTLGIRGVLLLMVLSSAAAYGSREGAASGGNASMGRLFSIPFEIGLGQPYLEGQAVLDAGSIGSALLSSLQVHGGSKSLQCSSGNVVSGAAGTAYSHIAFATPASGTILYARAYVYFDAIPTTFANERVLAFFTGGVSLLSLRITNTGQFRCSVDSDGKGLIGSNSPVILPGTWHEIELAFGANAAASSSYVEARLDSVTFVSTSTQDFGLNDGIQPNFLNVGWLDPPSANNAGNFNVFVDDVALNDSTGTVQNSFPGAGTQIYMPCIGDNARTGFVAGAGGTTSLYLGVSNTPPLGNSVETNTTQIKDAANSATDNYDANVRDYTTAGVPTTATITLVQAVCDNGIAGTVSARNGALKIVSNPAQVTEDTFPFGTASPLDVGVWPTNWYTNWGTAQVGDISAANRSVSPVLRVGKRTSTAREVDVDFMGLIVEYVPGAAVVAIPHRMALLGVGH